MTTFAMDYVLMTILDACGLSEDFENPDEMLRLTQDGHTVIAFVDGGDAYRPAIVFARWIGEEYPTNDSMRIHVPPADVNHDLAVARKETLSAYITPILDFSDRWHTVAEVLLHPPVRGEPILIDPEDAEDNEAEYLRLFPDALST